MNLKDFEFIGVELSQPHFHALIGPDHHPGFSEGLGVCLVSLIF